MYYIKLCICSGFKRVVINKPKRVLLPDMGVIYSSKYVKFAYITHDYEKVHCALKLTAHSEFTTISKSIFSRIANPILKISAFNCSPKSIMLFSDFYLNFNYSVNFATHGMHQPKELLSNGIKL